jgi:hypothetical protein
MGKRVSIDVWVSSTLLNLEWASQDPPLFPGLVRGGMEEPGGVKRSQKESKGVKRSQEELRGAKRN